jgi:hypothetical protein
MIKLKYKLVRSNIWIDYPILARDYFEEDTEDLDWDDTPRYNHAIEYLDVEPEKVACTWLELFDREGNLREVIKESFWNRGKNRVIESINYTDDESLLIIQIQIQDNPVTWHTMRFARRDEVIIPLYHSQVVEEADTENIKVIHSQDQT